MIEFKRGNLLDEDVQALVNAVNTVGVMGKGIALAFKKRFPKNYTIYQQACSRDEMLIGRMLVTETELTNNPRFIVNFPTKKHWKEKSRIEYIEMGLTDLVAIINEKQLQSIAVPALGCGLGGLDWQDVRPLIIKALEPVKNVQVVVFEPGESS
jgi:O-acetyl-ADP-ribose deacetylase (regulator of RNase III)